MSLTSLAEIQAIEKINNDIITISNVASLIEIFSPQYIKKVKKNLINNSVNHCFF